MNGSEGYEAEEVGEQLVIACCDPAEVFEFAEEALDQIALLVEFDIIMMRPSPLRPWRNDWLCTLIEDGVVEMLGIISTVGNNKAAGDAIDERGAVDHLTAMTGTCDQPGRVAECIGGHMQLGGQAAS